MPDPSPGAPWYVKIPPPIWTLVLFVGAFVAGRTFAPLAAVYVRAGGPAVGLGLAGLALAVWAERHFKRAGTEILPASRTNTHLVTGGPFRFTRNPMYLGIVMGSAAIALYVGTPAFYAVPVLAFLLCDRVFIPFEERKMERQFGAQYTEYLRRVRRWL
jgi:protein-S-isoprenylcysteine O-methyltransferase Ste14